MDDIYRTHGEFEPEIDGLEVDSFEFEFEEEVGASADAEAISPFTEAEEMELASQLLEITDEAELDQFLGGLIRRVGRALGKAFRSPTGRALGRFLKGAARVALPMAGRVLGGMVGGPAGAMIGGTLASHAGKMFGLELEGLSPEDQEFEMARRFVRFACAAARKAALASPTASPRAVARTAVAAAARRYVPGLLRKVDKTASPGVPGYSGYWVRHKSGKIILYGV